MRRKPHEDLSFLKGFCDKIETALLQIPEAAVDQYAGSAGRAACEIIPLDKKRLETLETGFARDPGALDPAADNDAVVFQVGSSQDINNSFHAALSKIEIKNF
jgi:hypothetical protein